MWARAGGRRKCLLIVQTFQIRAIFFRFTSFLSIIRSIVVSRMDLDPGRIAFHGGGQWWRVRRVHMYSIQQLWHYGFIWTNRCNSEGECNIAIRSALSLKLLSSFFVWKTPYNYKNRFSGCWKCDTVCVYTHCACVLIRHNRICRSKLET